MNSRAILFLLTGITCAQCAHAARPFVTDDARLTTAESCQLESWTRIYPHSHELWALPACNPFGNLEVTAGGARASTTGQMGSSDYVLQLKTLFRPLSENDWGWGLAIGNVRHPEINPGPNLLGNSYFYIPVSFSFDNDRLVVHTNLGGLRDRASAQRNVTWGIGAERKLPGAWTAIAETFGDHRNEPYWQLGLRYSVIPDRVQVDMTTGQQIHAGRDSHWFSIGFRLTPEALF